MISAKAVYRLSPEKCYHSRGNNSDVESRLMVAGPTFEPYGAKEIFDELQRNEERPENHSDNNDHPIQICSAQLEVT